MSSLLKEAIVDAKALRESALKNAVSVATTIMSADCIISNMRVENGGS